MFRRIFGVCIIAMFAILVSSCGDPVDDPCSRCPPSKTGNALVAELDPEVKAGLVDLGFTPTYKGVKKVVNKLASANRATRDKAARMLADAWVLVTSQQPGTKLEQFVRDEAARYGLDVDALAAAARSG